MSEQRTPWFSFWVGLSERIARWQSAILRNGPGGPLEARVRMWLVFRLSWLYHRVLDLASFGGW